MSSEDRRPTIIIESSSEDAPYDTAEAERNLMRAILLGAMSDLRKNGLLSRRAKEFFVSKDESHLYSFQSICQHLDIDPHTVLLVTGIRAGHSCENVLPGEQTTNDPSEGNRTGKPTLES